MMILNPVRTQISKEILLQLEAKLTHVASVDQAELSGQVLPHGLLAADLIEPSIFDTDPI
jgi:hypothetical protein